MLGKLICMELPKFLCLVVNNLSHLHRENGAGEVKQEIQRIDSYIVDGIGETTTILTKIQLLINRR